MRTSFFEGTSVKTSAFMDPAFVASFICEMMAALTFDPPSDRQVIAEEYMLDRGSEEAPTILVGAQAPKIK